jgi:AcrR family transcriptional regulator
VNRTEQRERTRQALLAAAAQEFEARGYVGTSLSDVAARLGLVRGTVHFHFRTKHALATAIVESFVEGALELQRQSARDAAGGVAAELVRLSQLLATRFADDAGFRAAVRLLGETDDLGVTRSGVSATWLAHVESLLAAGRASGELAADVDPGMLVRAIAALALSPATGDGLASHGHLERFWNRILPSLVA